MNANRLKNIRSLLNELGSLELQRRRWLGEDTRVSSYTELMCGLFDDCDIEEFSKNVLGTDPRLLDLKHAVDDLISVLNTYNEADRSDADILIDPQWVEITDQGAAVLKLWDTSQLESI
jgi:hypothetical protein